MENEILSKANFFRTTETGVDVFIEAGYEDKVKHMKVSNVDLQDIMGCGRMMSRNLDIQMGNRLGTTEMINRVGDIQMCNDYIKDKIISTTRSMIKKSGIHNPKAIEYFAEAI